MTDEAATEHEVLAYPADGLPDVIADTAALAAARNALLAGTGPLALDTERAHGFRYYPKAYLLQLRRHGSGTHLIDPVPLAERDGLLAALAADLAGTEWILHAATQDLPCLVELGMRPVTLFDTELAARLLGMPRVALATLLEEAFGVTLRKEHSAADWSRRPLPHDWLVYAALDVELLVELRDWLAERLDDAEKADWAQQEFEHLVARSHVPAPVRQDPWRRTSGLHAVRTPRGLAVVRELWQERDRIASGMDRAPGRILPDRAITALAGRADRPEAKALGRADVDAVAEFRWRQPARFLANWLAALDRAGRLTRDQLPPRSVAADGPPHPRTWGNRYPEASARWAKIREAVQHVAEVHELPVENLLQPDLQRRLAWEPPDMAAASLDSFLAGLGAREWQRRLVVPALSEAAE